MITIGRFRWCFPVYLLVFLMLSTSSSAEERPRELIQQYEQFGHRAVERDGFSVPTQPEKISAAKADKKLLTHQWVIGVEIGGEAVGYPIATMGLHELVNDTVGGTPIAVCW